MVHVWAAISMKGRGATIVFDGILNTKLYLRILDSTLLPSIQIPTPEHHHVNGQSFQTYFLIHTGLDDR